MSKIYFPFQMMKYHVYAIPCHVMSCLVCLPGMYVCMYVWYASYVYHMLSNNIVFYTCVFTPCHIFISKIDSPSCAVYTMKECVGM